MDGDVLEKVYQENLEERIISYLAEQLGISLEKAMDLYYSSRLADKIQRGVYGIQYLDYKVLVQILCETEKELLEGKEPIDWDKFVMPSERGKDVDGYMKEMREYDVSTDHVKGLTDNERSPKHSPS